MGTFTVAEIVSDAEVNAMWALLVRSDPHAIGNKPAPRRRVQWRTSDGKPPAPVTVTYRQ